MARTTKKSRETTKKAVAAPKKVAPVVKKTVAKTPAKKVAACKLAAKAVFPKHPTDKAQHVVIGRLPPPPKAR